MFDVSEAIKAQVKYCEDNKLPDFAPSSGRCWSCYGQIYEEMKHERIFKGEDYSYTTGISVEKASSELITGCPHCNRSYCD